MININAIAMAEKIEIVDNYNFKISGANREMKYADAVLAQKLANVADSDGGVRVVEEYSPLQNLFNDWCWLDSEIKTIVNACQNKKISDSIKTIINKSNILKRKGDYILQEILKEKKITV